MRSVSTLAHNNAIAPEARSDRTDISVGVRPRGKPTTCTAVRRAKVRVDEEMANGRLWAKYVYNGVSGGASLKWRASNRLRMAWMGQKDGSPDGPRPINSPLTPFFWFVNSNATKLGMYPAAIWWVDMRAPFPNRCTSHIRNGHDSGFEVLAYSPGRNKK